MVERGHKTIDELVAEARGRITALTADEAKQAVDGGAVIIDVRPVAVREAEGVVPGSVHCDLTELEWRATASDPGPTSDPGPDGAIVGRPVIVMCSSGDSSALAVDRLLSLGRTDASQLSGGFEGWKEAGLPVTAAPGIRPRDPLPARRSRIRATLNGS